jgi:hypothetical protein
MTNIIQFPVPIPVTNGNLPQFKFAIFGDNLATVTTAGYLTSAAIQAGIPLSNADVIQALYSFNIQTQSGTFGIFTVSISAATGQITLTQWANSGDAVLPTTANYLAHFTNTTGTISSAAGNVIQPGNISAGIAAGGTAGTLASYSATGSKGSLILAAVANTGNTNTTISNVAMGQASVVSIPDPANALGRFLVGATATPFVSGNFPQNSGTGGLMIDSGVPVSSIATTSTAVLLTPAADQTITVHNLTVAQGNLTAGSSGHAGTVASFPATASEGSLIVAAVNNGSGDFNTTISNAAAVGQSQVITIPNAGAATANFLLDTGAANILAEQQFVGISNVLTFGTGTWTTTRVAQGNYVQEHSAADETSIIAVDITPIIRATASKGWRLDSFDYIYGIGTAAMDAHTLTLDRIAYANNVAVSVTSITITATLATATQANPYVTNCTVTTPAFDVTADSKYVIEITANNAATTVYDFYGIMLKFSQTIA